MLARGASADGADAEAALLLASLEFLSSPLAAPFAACPGEGPVALGSRVVALCNTLDLVGGIVHKVVALGDGSPGSGPTGTCSLRRVSDGELLRDGEGQPQWFPTIELAPAGGSLGATPLLLAILLRCPGAVVAALVASQPGAVEKSDILGRTALAAAVEVPTPSIIRTRPHPCNKIHISLLLLSPTRFFP